MDQLGTVEIELVTAHQGIATSIKTILQNIGFSKINSRKTIADLRDALGMTTPDLLLCEAELPDDDACELIASIRHHETGMNPFIPIVTVTDEPSLELVKKVIDSGADDLLILPISTIQLQDRIEALVRSRKPFIVTSAYIGPDRHSSVRGQNGSDLPTIDVPNTLRAKVTGEARSVDLHAAIDTALAQVNNQKMDRLAQQVFLLVGEVAPRLDEGVDEKARAVLQKLLDATEDISRRMIGTEFEHISELCQTLIKVTNDILAADGAPVVKDVMLLKPLGQAIQAGFADTKFAETAHEISESVKIKTRGAAPV